jgi:hypothetical protein
MNFESEADRNRYVFENKNALVIEHPIHLSWWEVLLAIAISIFVGFSLVKLVLICLLIFFLRNQGNLRLRNRIDIYAEEHMKELTTTATGKVIACADQIVKIIEGMGDDMHVLEIKSKRKVINLIVKCNFQFTYYDGRYTCAHMLQQKESSFEGLLGGLIRVIHSQTQLQEIYTQMKIKIIGDKKDQYGKYSATEYANLTIDFDKFKNIEFDNLNGYELLKLFPYKFSGFPNVLDS